MAYQKSLFKKFLWTSLLIGFIPFVVLFLYIMYWAEDKLVTKIIHEQDVQAQIIIENISASLTSLQKEVRFIAKLDSMNDMLAEDLDKRISRILIQKKEDIGLHVALYAINNKGIIIASSDAIALNKKLKKSNNNLYLSAPIHASFDKNKLLGHLILQYNLQNLQSFFRHQQGIYNAIIDKNKKNISATPLPFVIKIDADTGKYIDDDYLIVYKKLAIPLENFYFVYAVNKDLALDFLHEFLYFMLYILPVVVFLIFFIAINRSRKIIKPIENLTKTAEEITKTKKYSMHITATSDDEIGRLTFAFNEMLQETNKALELLEKENQLRLKRFTKLIEIFNTIITTKSEDECIHTSISEIQALTQENKLYFSKKRQAGNNAIPVYVSDFAKDKKLFFGCIVLDFYDENEDQFYRAIASMISLQLDRIRLIDKTLSESHAKSAFISNMSHELRTPLNSILGFTQYLLVYEALNENQQDTVSNIENSAQYLLEMINGILDIAKIEAGMVELSYSTIDIRKLVQNIIAMLLPLAEEKQIDINFESREENECITIESDKKLIQQIVINLISNAIKFTQKGKATIFLLQDQKNLYIHVKDTGIGIEAHNMPKLFKEFIQLDNQMQEQYKGTGLGLSLSKKLAKLLGGDIHLSSEGLNKGSEAVFSLPL